ncbi:amine oxidase [Crepidotus variabilis]|uniref:Amine oxidase n=1 Tax=Crepidotus variabilis TaxID=179855 RepID=A0A9P6EGC5_9AGAR|nr:amine oxidase [Crepidotus variabilis]
MWSLKLVCPFAFLLLQTCILPNVAGLPSSSTSSLNAEVKNQGDNTNSHKVLILGGGVAGIIAARTLRQSGVNDFLIIEARSEIGGRMMSKSFGSKSKGNGTQYTIEQGANWIQGTQDGKSAANPIFDLAKKHSLKNQFNDFYNSVLTYDATGQVDFLTTLNKSEDQFAALTVLAGSRIDQGLVDVTGRTGYSLVGAKATDPHSAASEYMQFDFEYAQSAGQTSLIAASWNNNYTYNVDQGGFSDENNMSVDQRGFKTLIQKEAAEFLKPNQIVYNSTIKKIQYTDHGATVTLANGLTYTGEYALCTFSLGVLQHDDVTFEPSLPEYKKEAISSMVMATYTKIFLQFPKKFWFNTEMGLYADSERGRYPIWQSLDHPDFLPGSGIIFVTVTGDFANRVEGLPDAQVKAEVLSVLKSMFPTTDIPEPLDFFFPRWRANPLFRGSYSNWPPYFSSDHLINLKSNIGKLYFAGEATSRKYYGFLHGAYFEGQAIGTTIAGCIRNTSCPDLPRIPQITNSDPYQLTARAIADEL